MPGTNRIKCILKSLFMILDGREDDNVLCRESMVMISPADNDLRTVVQFLSSRLYMVKLVIAASDFIVTFGSR